MAYSVELTPRAVEDADSAAEYIRQSAPEAAQRWFDGLIEAMLSLEEMPQRCPLAPEAQRLGTELRQLLYGKRGGQFRIVFRVYEEVQPPVVRVVAIRHGARDRITREELEEIV
jgi:plasmid stabilization system protein ParE